MFSLLHFPSSVSFHFWCSLRKCCEQHSRIADNAPALRITLQHCGQQQSRIADNNTPALLTTHSEFPIAILNDTCFLFSRDEIFFSLPKLRLSKTNYINHFPMWITVFRTVLPAGASNPAAAVGTTHGSGDQLSEHALTNCAQDASDRYDLVSR